MRSAFPSNDKGKLRSNVLFPQHIYSSTSETLTAQRQKKMGQLFERMSDKKENKNITQISALYNMCQNQSPQPSHLSILIQLRNYFRFSRMFGLWSAPPCAQGKLTLHCISNLTSLQTMNGTRLHSPCLTEC